MPIVAVKVSSDDELGTSINAPARAPSAITLPSSLTFRGLRIKQPCTHVMPSTHLEAHARQHIVIILLTTACLLIVRGASLSFFACSGQRCACSTWE